MEERGWEVAHLAEHLGRPVRVLGGNRDEERDNGPLPETLGHADSEEEGGVDALVGVDGAGDVAAEGLEGGRWGGGGRRSQGDGGWGGGAWRGWRSGLAWRSSSAMSFTRRRSEEVRGAAEPDTSLALSASFSCSPGLAGMVGGGRGG